MAAVKITNARLLVAEATRLRMAQELATATRIQQNMLPEAPALPGWRCHARIETCFEVGGDLYDFHRRADGSLVILAGDVSGKGMGAALLMSSTLWSARVLYEACEGPLDLVRALNAVMQRNRGTVSFVTLFAGWLDPGSGRLRYVNAGHPEPHLVAGERITTLAATGIPLGMLESFEWGEKEAVVQPGALLALFSDGIPEAQHGEEFFDLERLGSALLEVAGAPDLAGASDDLIARIDAFAAGEPRADDVTLLLLRRE
jgi:serine phosphatase RsbU (regulator of sigma subunit)